MEKTTRSISPGRVVGVIDWGTFGPVLEVIKTKGKKAYCTWDNWEKTRERNYKWFDFHELRGFP